MTESTNAGQIDRLLGIMRRLRDPQSGCPWDREQSFATIAPYTIEEAYEVAEAIRQDDRKALLEELGDLLFQVVYHAQMAEEAGDFAFADVVATVSDKMERRHPHVFGNAVVETAAAQTTSWESIKAAERSAKGTKTARAGVLANIPLALPALTRAEKLQKRAARVGFDWGAAPPILAKIEEEIAELREAMAEPNGQAHMAEELGDLTFCCVNLARHLGVDPEDALRGTNAKFERRFAAIEAMLAAQGRRPEDATLSELDALWDKAKEREIALSPTEPTR